MRVDKCTMREGGGQRAGAIITNLDKFDAWPGLGWTVFMSPTNTVCCRLPLQALNTEEATAGRPEPEPEPEGNIRVTRTMRRRHRDCIPDNYNNYNYSTLWMRPCVQTNCTEDVWNRNILQFHQNECHWSINGGKWWSSGVRSYLHRAFYYPYI